MTKMQNETGLKLLMSRNEVVYVYIVNGDTALVSLKKDYEKPCLKETDRFWVQTYLLEEIH